MYVNDKDAGGKCATKGLAAEDLFIEIAEKKGVFLRRATTKEQKKHIDVFLDGGKKEIKVDVKSIKKLERNGDDTESPIWIEFKNVYGGNGWLYGESDFIAFERSDHFMVVRREELAKWCEENIDFENSVSNSKSAYKKVYTRYGRKDLITYIKREDVGHLIYRKWKKK